MPFNEYEKHVEIENEEGSAINVTGGGGGFEVSNGQALGGADLAGIIAGFDGSNYRFITVDTSGNLSTIVSSLPDVTIGSQSWPFTTDAAVTLDGEQVDISDRAARDLGKVDVAAFDVSLPAGTNRLGEIQLVDQNDYALDITADALLPANYSAVLIAGRENGTARIPSVTEDTTDGKYRMAIDGKISISAPEPPPTATAVSVAADTPLDVSASATTNYTITSGKTFTIQQLIAGAEGDPTEKGSKIEVHYVDSSSVEHIISRLYLTGESVDIYPDTSEARDGTALTGTGTELIRIYRIQFGGGTREIDAVVRGFEE